MDIYTPLAQHEGEAEAFANKEQRKDFQNEINSIP
jgi:hypothetical protein